MKEVQEQRQRRFTNKKPRTPLIKSFWIVVLVGIAGGIIAFIFEAVSSRG